MTPVMLARLQAASDIVLDELRKKTPAKYIIDALVKDHRAFYRRGNTNELRVAGVTATCTYSPDDVLLDRWKRNATIKIAMETARG